MADIRINSLPSTATSFNTDDYIAIDGASAGTRKMLAATLPLTDVTFGTSGPSAKSSIAARAARQGLVFDGTSNGATFSGPAIGTGDVSVSTWVNAKSFTGCSLVGQIGGVFDLFDASNMRFYDASGPTNYNITIPTQSTNKWFMLTWVRSSGVLYGYVNGVLAGSIACTASMTAFNYLGSINTFNKLNGTLSGAYIYNRAITAAEVVSLYEAGVPSGADYNTASNTAINTSNWNNSNWPYTSFTGVSSTAFTAVMSTVNIGIAEIIPTPVNGTAGQRIRITVSATLTSGATPTLRLFDASYNTVSNAVALTAGSNTVELVATAAFTKIGFYTSGVTSYAVSSVSVTRIGLLLAPDAAQAGGGLTWYDTSGNAANITLPASGVSWNVPSSLKTASGWTYAGTLTVAPASGTAATAVLSGTAAGSALNYALNGTNKYTAEYVSASDFYAIGRSAVAYDLVMKSGNLLIGTTTDGGQKLQVNGAATFAGTVRGTYLGVNVAPSSGSLRAYIVESAAEGTPTLTGGEVMVLQRNAIAAQSCEMALISGSTSTSAYSFGDKDSANIGRLSYDHSANSFSIVTNSATSTTFDSSGNIIQKLNGTAPSLGTNSTMTFELTSNTSLTIKVRGTDGTTRSVALTLA